MADIVVAESKQLVKLAENQMLRFPGNNELDNSHDTAAREDTRLLARIAGKDRSAFAALYCRRGKTIVFPANGGSTLIIGTTSPSGQSSSFLFFRAGNTPLLNIVESYENHLLH